MSEDVLQNWADSFQELRERVLGKPTCPHCGKVVRDGAVGFIGLLTPEQREAALKGFDGIEACGDSSLPAVNRPQPKDTGND